MTAVSFFAGYIFSRSAGEKKNSHVEVGCFHGKIE